MSEKSCNADEEPCGEAEKSYRIIGKSRRNIKPHQGQRHPRCAASRTLQPRDLPKQARDPKRRMQDQKRIKHSHAENRPVYNQYFFLHRIGKSSPHRALCTGFRSAHILLLLSYVDAPHHVTETIITKPPPRLNPNLQNLRNAKFLAIIENPEKWHPRRVSVYGTRVPRSPEKISISRNRI